MQEHSRQRNTHINNTIVHVDMLIAINNINGTNFPAPNAHFDNTCLFSDARGQNILNPKLI